MITLLESYVKVRMDLRELRILRMALVLIDSPSMLHDRGWTLGEIETIQTIKKALDDYANGVDQKSASEDD